MFRTVIAASAALALGTTVLIAESVGIDADGDGFVTANEYTEMVKERDFGAAFDTDADGMITREEFNAGVWRLYDKNEDEVWDGAEAADFESDYIRSGKWKR